MKVSNASDPLCAKWPQAFAASTWFLMPSMRPITNQPLRCFVSCCPCLECNCSSPGDITCTVGPRLKAFLTRFCSVDVVQRMASAAHATRCRAWCHRKVDKGGQLSLPCPARKQVLSHSKMPDGNRDQKAARCFS